MHRALSWPLPAVTAYRLAYILMRRARTGDDLARVDDLLTEAGQGETVDPLQHALHLVVIERLRDAANGPEERARLRKRSLAAFQRLRDSSRRADVDPTERLIQEDLFNLVELSGFLVDDDDYGALEGRAHLSAKFLPRQEDAYVLFLTEPVASQGGTDWLGIRVEPYPAWTSASIAAFLLSCTKALLNIDRWSPRANTASAGRRCL